MNQLSTLTLTTMALLYVVGAMTAGNANAQEKQRISFKATAENSKYAQQLNIDAGDVPNHIVRIFDIRYTFPNNAPVINGLKLVESQEHGTADRIEGNGPGTSYWVFMMENGDKFFARSASVVQTISGKLSATQVGNITGGTGKFAGMQGILRTAVNFNPTAGFAETQAEIEYSVGK
jgi:hypothetical protein